MNIRNAYLIFFKKENQLNVDGWNIELFHHTIYLLYKNIGM